MRVQYTIPGWEPAPAPGRAGAAEGPSMFETRLRESSGVMPPPSVEILGLNRPGVGELTMPPPPRPASLAFSDIDEDRRQWHLMLARHAEPPEDPTVYQMMVLLSE